MGGAMGDAIHWVLSNPYKANVLNAKWALRDAKEEKEKVTLILGLLSSQLKRVKPDSDKARLIASTIFDQERMLGKAEDKLADCMRRWKYLAPCGACEGLGQVRGACCKICGGTCKTAGSPKD